MATLLGLVLLAVLLAGLLSLSAIELRKSKAGEDVAAARANARMALMQAIGQLQVELGPDQRVSAGSGIRVSGNDPNWTGVWSSRRSDGSSHWLRDPQSGSMLDLRHENGWDVKARAWLVSGNADPGAPLSEEDSVEVVGPGSVELEDERVRVPLVDIGGSARGGMAWWTGDLGVRADVSTPDRFADESHDPKVPNGGQFRLMASQHAEPEVIGTGLSIADDRRASLVTVGTVARSGEQGVEWTRRHFHDFTTESVGILADVREGGLKGDLTAFFESDGEVPAKGGLEGLASEDPLIGDGSTRHRVAGPRFGLLHDWVNQTAPFSGSGVATRGAETDVGDAIKSEELALANEVPVRLKGATRTSLEPVLVEATNYVQVSSFMVTDDPRPSFQLRHHLYPRVVLWNPYNVELETDELIVMIQGNGRWEMWTENEHVNSLGEVTFRSRSQWLSFEGGRSTSFLGSGRAIFDDKGYKDPYMGSYYFSVPATSFGPGECLVFSPEYPSEYDGLSVYRPGAYDLSLNRLSCEVAPDPSRSFYVSDSALSGGMSYRPVRFWYAPTPYWSRNGSNGVANQSDDSRVVIKKLVGSEPVTFERFDELPQMAYVSASLQYGSGKEPRVAWDASRKMDIELLDKDVPEPTLEPDPRTREGIRMRWFEEHPSNLMNAGALSGQEQVFDEAMLANWNPRASYVLRSPWENIAGSLPSSGSGSGPWFFGIYTRDLPDNAVSWDWQEPVYRDGRYHGNPFGPPQESSGNHVVFELPRDETGVISLGQLQNVQLSEFVWHPSFAIGNSLVDPRLGLENTGRTVPPSKDEDEDSKGGFHSDVIGWSVDSERSADKDDWARTARALLQGVPEQDHVVYDLSYEANHALWDRFFLSSGDSGDKESFASDPLGNPLPNGRIRPAPVTGSLATAEDLGDFHHAAYHLAVDGAFNVNSTRVEAWKAIFASTRAASGGKATPFPRLLGIGRGDGGGSAGGDAWSGLRALTDEEIERLAEAMVEEVRTRGPFLSMADFVNRRLSGDQTSFAGALQAAIDRSGINASLEQAYPLANDESIGDYAHPDHIRDATRLEQTLKPSSKAWGAPGFVTQGDVLQVLAPVLTARSDSFLVRAYGESRSPEGKVTARAWCEAVVQRTPQPLKPDPSGINSEDQGEDGDFGRRFIITGFRWLRPEEV